MSSTTRLVAYGPPVSRWAASPCILVRAPTVCARPPFGLELLPMLMPTAVPPRVLSCAGSFTDIESAAEMRKRAEKLVRAGADAKELRVALKLPPPRVQRRKTLHGVYEHAGSCVARFHRQGKDYYVGACDAARKPSPAACVLTHSGGRLLVAATAAGTYDTEEQARIAYQEAIEDFAKFEGRYGGVVEFVADPVMETVALDPESAEFPYGTINRPEGLRFNRGNRKWTAVIHVNYEIVHMGTCAHLAPRSSRPYAGRYFTLLHLTPVSPPRACRHLRQRY